MSGSRKGLVGLWSEGALGGQGSPSGYSTLLLSLWPVSRCTASLTQSREVSSLNQVP